MSATAGAHRRGTPGSVGRWAFVCASHSLFSLFALSFTVTQTCSTCPPSRSCPLRIDNCPRQERSGSPYIGPVETESRLYCSAGRRNREHCIHPPNAQLDLEVMSIGQDQSRLPGLQVAGIRADGRARRLLIGRIVCALCFESRPAEIGKALDRCCHNSTGDELESGPVIG